MTENFNEAVITEDELAHIGEGSVAYLREFVFDWAERTMPMPMPVLPLVPR